MIERGLDLRNRMNRHRTSFSRIERLHALRFRGGKLSFGSPRAERRSLRATNDLRRACHANSCDRKLHGRKIHKITNLLTVLSRCCPTVAFTEAWKLICQTAKPLRSALLDVRQVASRLGVTTRFVRRLVDERRIPFCKIGKFVRFDPDDLEAWIAERRVDSVA